MDEVPRYLGITEFEEQLSAALASASFQPRYEDEAQLRADVAQVVQQFTEEKLPPLNLSYHIQGWGDEGSQPVPIFGVDFCPDMAIRAAELPAVVFILRLVDAGEEIGAKISSAIGQALICSRYYPAVIAFIFSFFSF